MSRLGIAPHDSTSHVAASHVRTCVPPFKAPPGVATHVLHATPGVWGSSRLAMQRGRARARRSDPRTVKSTSDWLCRLLGGETVLVTRAMAYMHGVTVARVTVVTH